jgi:hypothetical protein
VRLVDPLLPVLACVVATLGGHMHRAGTSHTGIIAAISQSRQQI